MSICHQSALDQAFVRHHSVTTLEWSITLKYTIRINGHVGYTVAGYWDWTVGECRDSMAAKASGSTKARRKGKGKTIRGSAVIAATKEPISAAAAVAEAPLPIA